MRKLWTNLIDGLTSLKLTIVCLSAALVLVFAGTLAQMHLSIDIVQQRFFQSLLVWWPPEPNGGFRLPVFPGGHLIGGVLLLNLIAAHIRRFKFGWRHAGLHLTHAGLIIMLAGGLMTHLFSVESFMRIPEGEIRNYSEQSGRCELALIDTSDAELDQVTAIPQEKLRPGSLISHETLPFSIAIRKFYPNSQLQMLNQAAPGATPAATQGLGAQITAAEAPRAMGLKESEMVSAVIEILPIAKPGQQTSPSLGTWLVSDALGQPQTFPCGGKQWAVALRPIRYYKPYTVKLSKFTHERYPGTEIPKNFSSSIQLADDELSVKRDVLIYMNHPLRYRGDTFYQSGFGDNDTTTILQVVHNPGALTPYVACVVVGVGLILQFSLHLVRFARRVRKPVIA